MTNSDQSQPWEEPADQSPLGVDRLGQIGNLFVNRADEITQEFVERALHEQPDSAATHREEMANRLPDFLRALGESLEEHDSAQVARQGLRALDHGEQRWECGWRLGEVVRDYQILRTLLFEWIDRELSSPMSLGELIVINRELDEAIMLASTAFATRSEQMLEEANEALEKRVEQRTKEVEAKRRQVRTLSLELIQAEQRERRHLAQILHDHLQQLLVAARMRLTALKTDDTELAKSRDAVSQLLDESIDATRTLTVELSPPLLYEKGLPPALEWLAGQMEEKYGLEIDVDVDAAGDPASDEVRISVYQAARELLFNAVKHSGATHTKIAGSITDDVWVQISITDDGVGFDVDGFLSKSNPRGFGLRSIRERVELMGGHFHIASTPGDGVRAIITAPLQPPADE